MGKSNSARPRLENRLNNPNQTRPIKVKVLVGTSPPATDSPSEQAATASPPSPSSTVKIWVSERNARTLWRSSSPSTSPPIPASAETDTLEDSSPDRDWNGADQTAQAGVKVWVTDAPPPQPPSVWTRLLGLLLLLMAIGLASGGVWLAVRLIINPGSVAWIQWLVPDWDRSPLSRQAIQTWAEIKADAVKAQQTVGTPTYLSTYPGVGPATPGYRDLLLPFYEQQAYCQTATPPDLPDACWQIRELRVYRSLPPGTRPGAIAYELLDRLTLSGPEELEAIAPLTQLAAAGQGSTRRLSLTTLTFVQGQAPAPGIWFHLSGDWKRGSSRIQFGQLLHYNPVDGQLQAVLPWTSAAAALPTWQPVTGSAVSELVVDQTLGLEPSYLIYQIAATRSPNRPMQATAISLLEPAIDTRTYANSLLLARSGLWSLAGQRLEAMQQSVDDWPTAAQAQLDVIRFHAQKAQAYADRDWASPRQQILALLLDGRWSEALQVLQTAHQTGYDSSSLLAAHSDRLWRRVEVATRIVPETDVWNWGVLLVALQHDRATALDWYRQRRGTGSAASPTATATAATARPSASDRAIQSILALLDPPSSSLPSVTVAAVAPPSAVAAADTAPPEPIAPSGQWIGEVTPVNGLDPAEWWTPTEEIPTKWEAGETGYRLRISRLQALSSTGETWQLPPFTIWDPTPSLQTVWQQLGLDRDRTLQLWSWNGSGMEQSPAIRSVMVQGLRLQDGTVELLAIGTAEGVTGQPQLATRGALPLVSPGSAQSLADWLSQQPDWQSIIQPIVAPAAPAPSGEPSRWAQDWSVQWLEASTGQTVLLLTQPVTPSNGTSSIATVLISEEGALLYDDRQSEQRLRGVIELDGLLHLIVETGQTIDLQVL